MTGYRGPRAETEEAIACRGTIARCSRMMESSVTGMRAAVFLYSVGTREARRSRDGNTYFVKKPLGSVVVSGDVVVDTPRGSVLLPEGSFKFETAIEKIERMPSTAGPVPKEVEHLTEPGMVLYGEQFLNVGDHVELTATVRPSREPELRYEVVADGHAVVVDRTLEAMGIDPEALKSRQGRMALIALMVVFALGILVTVILVMANA
jgi:hypothetical protein